MKKYTRRTKISEKILHVVASAVLLCTLLCGGAVYLYFKPVTENLLKERSTNMVQKMAREAVNSLESMELYAQNISFDETVQESLKKNSGRQSRIVPILCIYSEYGEKAERISIFKR